MAIAIGIWQMLIFLALLGTAASWSIRDKNNYTDAISGILATILWFVSGIACLIGIQAESMIFTAGWLMWIFVAVGVIEAILTIVKILDIVTARKEQRYTSLDPIHL